MRGNWRKKGEEWGERGNRKGKGGEKGREGGKGEIKGENGWEGEGQILFIWLLMNITITQML